MDPNACLKRIASLFAQTQTDSTDTTTGEELDFACLDLFEWLERGGFEPDWTDYNAVAVSYYRTMAVGFQRGERPTDTSGD